MKITDVGKQIKRQFEKGVTRVPILIEGDMGIGKSQVVKGVGDELGVEVVDLRLATQEPGDLIGMPRANVETGRTEWLKPTWWPKMGTKGILFFDELNRAPADVRQAVFQVLTEHKLHTHELPEGWMVIAAINPEGSFYQVEKLDAAMNDRFIKLQGEADVESWIIWARGHDLDPLVIKFVATHKDLLNKPSEECSPTPRGWEMISTLLKNDAIDKENEYSIYAGKVGTVVAQTFIKFIDRGYVKPIGGDEVLDNYPKVKEQLTKQAHDYNYATATDLVALIIKRKSLTKDSMGNLKEYLLDTSAENKTSILSKLPGSVLQELAKDSALLGDIKKMLQEVDKHK